MRISDWSSDVCSSDLFQAGDHLLRRPVLRPGGCRLQIAQGGPGRRHRGTSGKRSVLCHVEPAPSHAADRKSVVSGKSVSVRVDLGGRSILTKKKKRKKRKE